MPALFSACPGMHSPHRTVNIDCIEAGQLLTRVASYLYELSHLEFISFEQTEPLLRRAIAIFSQSSEEVYPSVANAQQILGWVYTTSGKYIQAEQHLQQALEIHGRAANQDHRSIS